MRRPQAYKETFFIVICFDLLVGCWSAIFFLIAVIPTRLLRSSTAVAAAVCRFFIAVVWGTIFHECRGFCDSSRTLENLHEAFLYMYMAEIHIRL